MTDRRARRHEATRQEILAAAWELARARGLTGWSLREVADAVGMRAPSLYVYFDRKVDIYDAMFMQGYRQLLEIIDTQTLDGSPGQVLHRTATTFLDFFLSDTARHQLLFLRVIPHFEPSPEAYAVAETVLERLRAVFRHLGLGPERSVDLWTALLTGIASQQASNDPGGDRWTRLVEPAIAMFLSSERRPA